MDSCQLIRKETKATLERWRSEGIGIKFLKLCGRVLYRQVDIEAFEESCLATSTKTLASTARVGIAERESGHCPGGGNRHQPSDVPADSSQAS